MVPGAGKELSVHLKLKLDILGSNLGAGYDVLKANYEDNL